MHSAAEFVVPDASEVNGVFIVAGLFLAGLFIIAAHLHQQRQHELSSLATWSAANMKARAEYSQMVR